MATIIMLRPSLEDYPNAQPYILHQSSEHKQHGKRYIQRHWDANVLDQPIKAVNAHIHSLNITKSAAQDLKLERRREKNRIYAQESRKRKHDSRQSVGTTTEDLDI